PSASTRWPGAVPRGLRRTTAPSITSACFSLTGAITRPNRANRAFSSSMSAGSRWRGRPSAAAAASRVRSSSGGPGPPMAITTSARERAWRGLQQRGVVGHRDAGPGVDADLEQLRGEVQGVGVGAQGREQLGTDGEYLRSHYRPPLPQRPLQQSPTHLDGGKVPWSGRVAAFMVLITAPKLDVRPA